MALGIGKQVYTGSNFANAGMEMLRLLRRGLHNMPQGVKNAGRGMANILTRGTVHAPIQTVITAMPAQNERWWAHLNTLWSNKAMGQQYMRERVNQGLVEAAKELGATGRRDQARQVLELVRNRVNNQVRMVRTNQAIAGAEALGAAGVATGALYGGSKLLHRGSSDAQGTKTVAPTASTNNTRQSVISSVEAGTAGAANPGRLGSADTQSSKPAAAIAQTNDMQRSMLPESSSWVNGMGAAAGKKYILPLMAGLLAGKGMYDLTGMISGSRKWRRLRRLLALGGGGAATLMYMPRLVAVRSPRDNSIG